MKHPSAVSVITKVRKLINTVRKSSVANEEMIKRCGKTLTWDFSTSWNSTSDTLRRLLKTRAEPNQLHEDLGMDTFLTSDWEKLENLSSCLIPLSFTQTDFGVADSPSHKSCHACSTLTHIC